MDLTKIKVQMDEFTLDEIELIEDLLDMPIGEVQKPGTKQGKILKTLVYIAARREYPDVTMEDVGRMKTSQFMAAMVGSDEPDPLENTDGSGS